MITLTEFKKFLDIDLKNTSKDELLQECIKSAVNEINGLTNRLLEDGQRQDIFDGNGTQFAFLNQYPVTEITKLQYLSHDGFIDIVKDSDSNNNSALILDAGKICLINNYVFPEGESNILVQYRAGYMTADDWKENTKYKKDSIVAYESVFYRCKDDHQSGDIFEPDYWDKLNSQAMPDDLTKAVKYLAARNFYDSPAGKNLFMKKSESLGGGFSGSINYKEPELENIINSYGKPNI